VGAMKETIGKLVRLQVFDTELRKLAAELEEKPRLLAGEKARLDDARARLAEAEKRGREAHMAADRKELDVRTREDQIKKLEGQLNGATSNKVYSELLLSIKSARMDIEKIEESILVMMDEAEGLEAEIERARVVVRNAEDEYREAEAALRSQAKAAEERLADRRKLRDFLATEVDPEVLAVYDRVREGRKGIGISGVVTDAEGSHFCVACQMEVNLQDINVAMGGGRIVQCKSCNRILNVENVTGEPPAAE
jgi:predicted  nucleic acid-binding Zn-ribbon protein